MKKKITLLVLDAHVTCQSNGRLGDLVYFEPSHMSSPTLLKTIL